MEASPPASFDFFGSKRGSLLVCSLKPQVSEWINNYFERENDDIGSTLEIDLIRIARHIAQNGSPPAYYLFAERDKHDLDKITGKIVQNGDPPTIIEQQLRKLYNESGTLWQTFYKTLDRFRTAFNGAIQRQVSLSIDGPTLSPPGDESGPTKDFSSAGPEPTEDFKEQILSRDKFTCQACGAAGKKFRLQVDHIIPVKLSGEPTMNNLQTLCKVCNNIKAINSINFKIFVTPLKASKTQLDFLKSYGQEDVRRSITRLVNFFYHCQAVCDVRMHERRGSTYYSTWEIELYSGNDPSWLLQHKAELLNHINSALKCPQVENILIVSAG